jgi:hypothetical protein
MRCSRSCLISARCHFRSRVDGGLGENFLRLAALVGRGHVSGPLVSQVGRCA